MSGLSERASSSSMSAAPIGTSARSSTRAAGRSSMMSGGSGRRSPVTSEPGDEKRDVSAEINDLGERALGNYQLSTTNQQREEITTTESVTAGALADDGAAPPKADPRGTRLPEGWAPEGELRQWTLDHIAEK